MLGLEELAGALDIGGAVIRNRIFLAPLSGITDRAFRSRAYLHGAGMVVSEMVASGELARGRTDSQRRIGRSGAALHVVQLAGRDTHWMAEGARIAAGEGADIIDINMGCPAKKVTGGYCGSGVTRSLYFARKLALKILERPGAETAFDGLDFPKVPFRPFAPLAAAAVTRWSALRDVIDDRRRD